MVRDIIEDVRNKLNPFWNLPDMILNKNYEDGKLLTIMCEMSDVANSQKNIITDNLDFFQDVTEKYNIVLKHIYKKGFPNDTLYRYNYFLLVKEHLLNNTEYMFYFDVDMDIIDYIFEDILPNYDTPLLGTRHPGFIMPHPFPEKCGSPDNNPECTAYIPEDKRINNYIAGGFNGGITKFFIEMCETISKNIKIDKIDSSFYGLRQNIIRITFAKCGRNEIKFS